MKTKIQSPASVMAQCLESGWDFGLWTEPQKKSRVQYFNPSVFTMKGNVWLMLRRCVWSAGKPFNSLTVAQIMSNMRLGVLRQVGIKKHSRNHEDPRVVETESGIDAWCCTYTNAMKPEQACLSLDGGFNETKARFYPFGGNLVGGPEKNWCPFDMGTKLVYHVANHIAYDLKTSERFETSGVSWNYGQARGGTPAVLVGDEYVSFFHSSIPWRNMPGCGPRLRYYMGAYAFESSPPYRVTRWTMEPILSGSQHGPSIHCSPAVVFPCGAIAFGDDWLISMGINDCASAWVKIPMNEIDKRMT